MAASGFLEPLDENVAREMCSREVIALHRLLSRPVPPRSIISEWQ